MAIQHHPLSNALLGDYVGFRHIGKVTVFAYTLGFVELSCPDNTAFKWDTHIDADIKDIADKAEKDYWARLNQLDNERVNLGYQGLDQHCIDGMDDMAFGTELGSSIRSEADGSRDRISTNDISNNEEDEASTNNQVKD